MASTSLRERKKALTRSVIVETAVRLFVEQGFDETSLEQICDAALVSRRTFFRYFGSKEDLVLAPSKEHLANSAALLRDWPEDGSWREALFAMVEASSTSLEQDRETQAVRWRLLTTTPSLFAAYLGLLAGFEDVVRSFLVDRAKDDLGDDAQLIAAVTPAAFRVATQTWISREGAGPLRELAERSLRAALAHWS